MDRTKLCLGLLLLALPVAAVAEPVDRTFAMDPDGSVEVDLIAGDVRVEGWDRDEVKVTGTINERFEELEISSEDDGISIEVEIRRSSSGYRTAAELKIFVPREASVEIETVSAPVKLHGIDGEISVESVSGRIEISAAGPRVEASSVSGSIEVSVDRPLRRGDFESVTGDIDLAGPLASNARIDFESVNGSITLKLPEGTCADFSVETFNGGIRNEFGPKARRVSDLVPGKELSFSTGSCSARVDIEAFNGTVSLERR